MSLTERVISKNANLQICRADGAYRTDKEIQVSLFDHLNSPKIIKNRGFARTDGNPKDTWSFKCFLYASFSHDVIELKFRNRNQPNCKVI
jgi:hypothetical protein